MQTFILTFGAAPLILPTEVVAVLGSIFLERKVAVKDGGGGADDDVPAIGVPAAVVAERGFLGGVGFIFFVCVKRFFRKTLFFNFFFPDSYEKEFDNLFLKKDLTKPKKGK